MPHSCNYERFTARLFSVNNSYTSEAPEWDELFAPVVDKTSVRTSQFLYSKFVVCWRHFSSRILGASKKFLNGNNLFTWARNMLCPIEIVHWEARQVVFACRQWSLYVLSNHTHGSLCLWQAYSSSTGSKFWRAI